MRDPRGSVEFVGDVVRRTLKAPLLEDDFLCHPSAHELVQRGQLVAFESEGAEGLRSPRLPFVSYPHEWSDAQLFDAGRLTLDVAEAAADAGYELKDASAWNVIFDGCRPTFCDHLSFEQLHSTRWWAFGQFVRHFVLPLAASRVRGVAPHETFRAHRDGLTLLQARRLLGWRRFLTRTWPLLLNTKPRTGPEPATAAGRPLHARLIEFLRWQLAGVKPTAKHVGPWIDYELARHHYSAASIARKTELVSVWIGRLQPAWVLDLGCNTGEFSRLAAGLGAKVVSVDGDSECIQALYLGSRGSEDIHPVLADLDDLYGGRGWAGKEFGGLRDRLFGLCDVTMLLGLLHHLAISASIPWPEIAAFAADCTRRHAIVEYIGEHDPMAIRLCAERRREPAEFDLAAQQSAFEVHFRTVESAPLPDGHRWLALLEKRHG